MTKKASANHPIEQIVVEIKNGNFKKEIDLCENDLYLIKLNKL